MGRELARPCSWGGAWNQIWAHWVSGKEMSWALGLVGAFKL